MQRQTQKIDTVYITYYFQKIYILYLLLTVLYIFFYFFSIFSIDIFKINCYNKAIKRTKEKQKRKD